MSKVATIELVSSIEKHPNADTLDIAKILGWQVVCKAGSFSAGDKVIYINIDSVLEDRPEYEFLRQKNFRVRPIKLRGEYSQGILFPLSIGGDIANSLPIGNDVSELVGAKHFEKPLPVVLSGKANGPLPSFIVKTDEDNLRNVPEALEELHGEEIYATMKMDGTSATYYVKDGKFGFCSRNIDLDTEDETSVFYKIEKKHNIKYKMLLVNRGDWYIQGEIYGPGIQKNPMGMKEVCFSMFNGYSEGAFWSLDQLALFSEINFIPMVKMAKLEGENASLLYLISLARMLKYENNTPAEGIVIRPVSPKFSKALNKGWSVKVLNENYKESE